MQDSIGETRKKIQKMDATPEMLEAMPDNATRKKYLAAENKVLRASLHKMSAHLNNLLNKVQQENSRSPAKAYAAAAATDVCEAALQNSDKAIANLQKEKARLQRRLQQVSQPDYLLKLKGEVKVTEAEVKEQRLLKKQLQQEHLKTDKALGQVMEQQSHADSSSLTQIQDLTNRMTLLSEQISSLHLSNRKAENLRSQQTQQLSKLRERIGKLQQIASHYGVSEQLKSENSALLHQIDSLERQIKIQTQALEVQNKKNDLVLQSRQAEVRELQEKEDELVTQFNLKVRELAQSALVVRDLIQKARATADKSLADILGKWQVANDATLQKYPLSKQYDFDDIEGLERAKPQVQAAGQGSIRQA